MKHCPGNEGGQCRANGFTLKGPEGSESKTCYCADSSLVKLHEFCLQKYIPARAEGKPTHTGNLHQPALSSLKETHWEIKALVGNLISKYDKKLLFYNRHYILWVSI